MRFDEINLDELDITQLRQLRVRIATEIRARLGIVTLDEQVLDILRQARANGTWGSPVPSPEEVQTSISESADRPRWDDLNEREDDFHGYLRDA